MNEQNGTLCLIYKGVAGTEVLVGQSMMNITYGGSPIDISSKSDSDWANLLNDEITAQQITIAGTLTYNSDFTFESVKADGETGQHDKYIFRFGLTGDRVEGYFIPVNVTDSTVGGERVSTAVSFNSSDQVLSGGSAGPVSIVGSVDPFGDGSLIAKYQLDGDAQDTTGNFHGTASNVTYDTGKFGQGASFNGTSSYIANGSLMNVLLKSSFSLSCFFKVPDGSNSAGDTVIYLQDNNNGHLPLISINMTDGYNVSGTVRTNSPDLLSSPPIPIEFGKWHHAVLVLSDSGGYFYLDTVLVASSLFDPVFTSNSSGSFDIGRVYQEWIGYQAGHFNGMIDQVELYNRALTASEVGNLYTQTIDGGE